MTNRDEMLKQLTILDFMATDLHLYLDTHNDDKEAIEKYNDIIRQADKCRMEYEKLNGPLCAFRSASGKDFNWVNDPWPWQKDFNFHLI